MLAFLLFASCGQGLAFDGDRALDPTTRAAEMSALAREVLPSYSDPDNQTNLDNRFRIEGVSGDYAAAIKDIDALRETPERRADFFQAGLDVQYLVVYKARSAGGANLGDSLRSAYRDVVEKLDDRTDSVVVRSLVWLSATGMQGSVDRDLKAQKGKKSISMPDALRLIRDYQVASAYQDLAPVTTELVAEDDANRYVVQQHFLVKTVDGASVDTTVVRPKAAKKLPAILTFTIYAEDSPFANARMDAANGYVGVIGYTRGKGASPGKVEPYVHDGQDAAALIDWIAKQPWSDGRVGMYSGSYNGFTQWAAAKYHPKGLKAMMDGASACPGIDVPMEGNVVWNFVYSWPFFTTNNKTEDNETYGDYARWQKLDRAYYVGGQPYRDLDKIDGKPNPIWDEWISHPTYDSYWQARVPYKKEFANIDIPILTTAGYYYGGPGACAYYYREHTKYDSHADHYLLIGPWDHPGAQHGVFGLLGQVFSNMGGWQMDPVARLNLELTKYQWFDYVFKNGPKPELLKDKVNFELTGANAWMHAPSLAAMSNSSVRLFLNPDKTDAGCRLTLEPGTGEEKLTVDFKDRKDVDSQPNGLILSSKLESPNAIVYVSDPFKEEADVSGFLSGRLSFVTNKRDFDVNMKLYELTPDQKYFQIGEYWCRASSMEDLTRRRLLTPGKKQQLSFQAIRLMAHRCSPGSRLVLTTGVIKEVGREINYGSGKPVIDESIADAGDPMQITWLADSYIDVPVRR